MNLSLSYIYEKLLFHNFYNTTYYRVYKRQYNQYNKASYTKIIKLSSDQI